MVSSFDSVGHQELKEMLNQRVGDGVVRRLVSKWLHAGGWEMGQVSYPEQGTPQGCVVSPLLNNIYLHEALDKWFEEQVKPLLKGRAFMVRYADDFVMGFGDKRDAERILAVLGKRLARYGLELHPQKMRLVRLPGVHPCVAEVAQGRAACEPDDRQEPVHPGSRQDEVALPQEGLRPAARAADGRGQKAHRTLQLLRCRRQFESPQRLRARGEPRAAEEPAEEERAP